MSPVLPPGNISVDTPVGELGNGLLSQIKEALRLHILATLENEGASAPQPASQQGADCLDRYRGPAWEKMRTLDCYCHFFESDPFDQISVASTKDEKAEKKKRRHRKKRRNAVGDKLSDANTNDQLSVSAATDTVGEDPVMREGALSSGEVQLRTDKEKADKMGPEPERELEAKEEFVASPAKSVDSEAPHVPEIDLGEAAASTKEAGQEPEKSKTRSRCNTGTLANKEAEAPKTTKGQRRRERQKQTSVKNEYEELKKATMKLFVEPTCPKVLGDSKIPTMRKPKEPPAMAPQDKRELEEDKQKALPESALYPEPRPDSAVAAHQEGYVEDTVLRPMVVLAPYFDYPRESHFLAALNTEISAFVKAKTEFANSMKPTCTEIVRRIEHIAKYTFTRMFLRHERPCGRIRG